MSRLRPSRIVALVIALVVVASACGTDSERAVISSGIDPVSAPRDVVETAANAELTQLPRMLESSGLGETLGGDGPFTLFAPSDDAFEALDPALVDLLLEPTNQRLLTDILSYHVVEGRHLVEGLLEEGDLETLEGSSLEVGSVELAAEDDAEPTTDILVNEDATVTESDQLATNGVVHIIDTVLVPADRADEFAELIASIPEPTDIVSTLEAEGNFTELLAALEATGLDQDLGGEGTFTLFAPNDDAFAALTDAQRELLATDTDLAATVLRFHMFRTEVLTDAILTRRQFSSAGGDGATFARVITHPPANEGSETDEGTDEGEAPRPTVHFDFEGIEVIETDIVATNGVIHVIDELAIPDAAKGPGGF